MTIAQPATVLSERVLAEIVDAIRTVRFGTVQITIHNAAVVQIERAEKIRLTPPPPDDGRPSDHSASPPDLRWPSRITGRD